MFLSHSNDVDYFRSLSAISFVTPERVLRPDNVKQYMGLMCTADRLLKYGRTDGFSIVSLFRAAGMQTHIPEEIPYDMEAMFYIDKNMTMYLIKRISGFTQNSYRHS